MSDYEPAPALGLSETSTNEEIQAAAFEFIRQVGYLVVSTISSDGHSPTARGLELHQLDADGNFYVGMAKGKPVYHELLKSPQLCGVLIRETSKHLSVAVRLNAHVMEVDPGNHPEIYARYWELNGGTEALYRKDLGMFRIFLLDRGEGEIFHLPESDVVCRVRFGFGGQAPRPWAYEISDRCIGCGACAEACMKEVIHPDGHGRYRISHFNCLECGRCYSVCPNDAIERRV